MAHKKPTDLGAGLTGLIVGVTVLFAIMFGIVKLTNAKYASHEPTAPAAEAQR